MNIKCNLKELINGLNIVSKTSITRTTMPILEGVLIEAENNKLKLTTNDLEIGTEHSMDCKTIENGKTVVTETGHKAEDNPEDVVKVDLRKSK